MICQITVWIELTIKGNYEIEIMIINIKAKLENSDRQKKIEKYSEAVHQMLKDIILNLTFVHIRQWIPKRHDNHEYGHMNLCNSKIYYKRSLSVFSYELGPLC